MNKWLTKGLNVLSIATLVVGTGMICSCSCGKIETPNDVKYLSEFQEINFESNENWLTSDNLSLYVDYSTCMAQALKTSPFFSDMIPSLTAATKNFYSIKGDSIKKEAGKVFTLLSSIQETNYADILTAAENIVAGKSEGVLLTDGEYYEPTVAKSHVNDPYLKDVFSKWLKKGHDIYVIAEPYKEAYNGNVFDKKRFYFLFTDSRVPNNIYNRILQCVDMKKYPNVDIYHMSVSHPIIMAEGKYSKPDGDLAATVDGYGNFEIQDWSIDWNSIQNIYPFLNAEFRPGIAIVIEQSGLDAAAQWADVVFTGEGSIDFQTKFGKTPAGVAETAKRHGKPVIAVAGHIGTGIDELHEVGIDAVFGIAPGAASLSELLADAAANVTRTTEQIVRTLQL